MNNSVLIYNIERIIREGDALRKTTSLKCNASRWPTKADRCVEENNILISKKNKKYGLMQVAVETMSINRNKITENCIEKKREEIIETQIEFLVLIETRKKGNEIV